MEMTQEKISEELGVLRQLLHREQAFFDIESQQAKLFEKDSYDSIKNLIFLTRKVFSLHLSVLEQSKTGKPIDVPDLAQLLNVFAQGFSTSQQRAFQSAIVSMKEGNTKELAEKITDYIQRVPDDENYVVFSLLPALYSCLWSQEESNSFIDLLLCFSPHLRPSMTRLLLVHQSFFVFLSSIQAEAGAALTEQAPLQTILNLIKSRSFLFPSTLRTLMSRTEDPVDFFIECIMKQLFVRPALYGLVPSSETKTFEYLIPTIEQCKPDVVELVQYLKDSTNAIQMLPVESQLASVLINNEQLIYLFKNDCKSIVGITGIDVQIPDSDSVFQIPFKRSIAVQQQESTEENEIDPFEALLRSLVIQLDVSRAYSNIIETLESALTLHAGASRLKYELKLDEFKQMKAQKNAPDDVPFYVNLLTTAYDERMKHRKATLSNSTTSDVFKVQHLQGTQALQFLLQTRQMTFFNMWDQTGAFNIDSDDTIKSYCTEKKSFMGHYKELVEGFLSFAASHNLTVQKDKYVPIVFNRLTHQITLSEFRKYHPEIAKIDEQIHAMIRDHKEDLYASNQLPFLQVFKDDPSLMGLAAQHLRHAFDEDSAIPIAEWIDRSLSALIHVLSFQGMKEIGADHWLPMTLILFIHVNPEKIASVAAYMHHCILSITAGDLGPVSQSVEYNVTMTHSAAQYFQKELPKYLPKEE